MILTVDPASAVPAYEQVRAQVAAMIASAVLAPGAQLPAIRQLAGDLGLAPGTVARAYAELERAGLVGGRGRRGTRVTGPTPPDAETMGALVDEAAREFALRARQLGADPVAALDAVSRHLALLDGTADPVRGPLPGGGQVRSAAV